MPKRQRRWREPVDHPLCSRCRHTQPYHRFGGKAGCMHRDWATPPSMYDPSGRPPRCGCPQYT